MKRTNNSISEKDLTFDLPVEYKGLKFYPVKMLDYFDFNISISCLLLDQFNDKDVNQNFSILQMSYLDYLFFYNEREKEEQGEAYNIIMLITLLSICMKENFTIDSDIELYIDKKGKHTLKIKDVIIDGKDFEEIRRIICYQNDVDLDIFDLDPLVRKNIYDTLKLKNRSQNDEMCSLEDQIVSVMICTSLQQEQINDLTIRKFRRILERVDHKINYEIYKSSELSGFVKFDKKYPHWLSKIDKDVSKNITSLDDIKGKINIGNGNIASKN